MENQSKVTLVAVGDLGLPGEHPEELFDLTRSTLREGDITFGQLERNLSFRARKSVTAQEEAQAYQYAKTIFEQVAVMARGLNIPDL